MFIYRKVDHRSLADYSAIDMIVQVKSQYKAERIDGGLGGILLRETAIEPYEKNLGQYVVPSQYEFDFDITNWGFYLAFFENKPVGGITLAPKTPGLNNNEDRCVVFDLRVSLPYKGQGIGQTLLALAMDWAKDRGLKQISLECQNTNVDACKFYKSQGAVLTCIQEQAYAHTGDKTIQDEIMLIWTIYL